MNDLQELKRLAEAATPGEWKVTGISVDRTNLSITNERYVICTVHNAVSLRDVMLGNHPAQQYVNANFICAANPQTVLELIARMERQTAALTDLRKWFEYERNIKSKGCGGGWDMLRCDEQIAVIDAAMIGIIVQEDQAESEKVPDGWKLVPIEPTEDMVIAGFESVPDRCFDGDKYPEEYDAMSGCQQAEFRAKRCYASMLEAAPKVPPQGLK